MTLENGNLQPDIAPQAPETGEQLAAILGKLEDVQRELEMRNRHLAEFRELQDDLAVIAKDMFQTAVVELDQVAPFIQTGDFTALAKRLLRNVNRISQALTTLESAADFAADAQPITHDLFHRFILQLDELEQKGYFRLANELQMTLDELVKTLVHSNLLPAIRHALAAVRDMDNRRFDDYSLWRFYRDTKSPEARRLLGFGVALIREVARELPAAEDRAD